MKMLEDLAEVVQALHECTKGEWQHRKGSAVVLLGNEGGFDISDCPLPRSNAAAIAAAINFLRTHHATIRDMAARLEAAERDAARYRSARDANPDDNVPYIAIERQDSWGKWRTDCLFGSDADAAIDAMQETGR